MAEQGTHKPLVGGSNPPLATIFACSHVILTLSLMYSTLRVARSRGVAAKHAALSRPRSRVRIPSGPQSYDG